MNEEYIKKFVVETVTNLLKLHKPYSLYDTNYEVPSYVYRLQIEGLGLVEYDFSLDGFGALNFNTAVISNLHMRSNNASFTIMLNEIEVAQFKIMLHNTKEAYLSNIMEKVWVKSCIEQISDFDQVCNQMAESC